MEINQKKPTVGFYGISGCAGCLLTVLFENSFKELTELVNIKAFPLIKEDSYKGYFDIVFIEGTVCFDEDILIINKLRKRAKVIVALGSCSHVGGVPSIKNFKDKEKIMKFVYPRINHLKEENPTPIENHIKVDYYIPQCPPNKSEIIEFIKIFLTERKWKNYNEPVCFECRKKANPCVLEKGEICLGPITNGGCGALCPSNKTECYGCRGPTDDANIRSFKEMLKNMGYKEEDIFDKMETFAGLQFKNKEEKDEI
ncbi:MAG: Ni/Fe hydrogenase subunit delta [Candidatus Pacearchaeota archaeon]